jgi:hypothetical protein
VNGACIALCYKLRLEAKTLSLKNVMKAFAALVPGAACSTDSNMLRQFPWLRIFIRAREKALILFRLFKLDTKTIDSLLGRSPSVET